MNTAFQIVLLPLLGAGSLLLAQPKLSDVPPETVLATVNGKPLTAGQLADFVEALPPQQLSSLDRDRKEFIRQWALMSRLAELAEKEGLDKEKININRMNYVRLQIMMSAIMEKKSNDTQISDDVLRPLYEERVNQAGRAALTKMLYVSFAADGKGRTEAEAKARIESLRQQAAGGADFIKLIEENSDDAASKAKKGDYQPIRQSDPMPDGIKSAIFALKPGEYSQPIRQAGGFYVFRLEKFDQRSFEDMKQELISQQRQAAFGAWFGSVRQGLDVQFTNEEFFAPKPPAAKPAKP
jgi:peptidyl-prolyl cis-trans isomerase C